MCRSLLAANAELRGVHCRQSACVENRGGSSLPIRAGNWSSCDQKGFRCGESWFKEGRSWRFCAAPNEGQCKKSPCFCGPAVQAVPHGARGLRHFLSPVGGVPPIHGRVGGLFAPASPRVSTDAGTKVPTTHRRSEFTRSPATCLDFVENAGRSTSHSDGLSIPVYSHAGGE
jgi:hypothetical protein